ncbi:MAG: hypothetical protein KF777_07590 [Planctomycetaceae bacterium]|nr:hypothetical protein [Planctomycetaceae bacterium]
MSSVPLPGDWLERLTACRRHRNQAIRQAAIGKTGLWVAAAIAFFFAVDLFWGLGPAWRVAALLALVGLALWCGRRVIAAWNHRASLSDAAQRIEATHAEFEGRLRTLVDRSSDSPENVFLRLLRGEVRRELPAANWDVDAGTRQSAVWLFAMFGAWLTLFVVSMLPVVGGGLLWARLFVPWGNWPTALAPRLEAIDWPEVVPRGEPLTLKVRWRGESDVSSNRPHPRLKWSGAGQPARWLPTAEDPATGGYSVTIEPSNGPLHCEFVAGRHRTETATIRVAHRPVVESWSAMIHPPAYTGHPSFAWSPEDGPIQALPGTRLVIRVRCAEPLAELRLTGTALAEHSLFQWDSDRQGGTANVMPTRIGDILVEAVGREQLAAALPPISWDIRPDEPPVIRLLDPPSGTQSPPDGIIALRWAARDDSRLTRIELHWETTLPSSGVVTIPLEGWRSEARVVERLDLAALKIDDAASLSWRVRAVDNREPGGPQETWSDVRTILFSSRASSVESLAERAEIKEELANAQQRVARELAAARQRHAESMAAATGREPAGKAELPEKLAERVRDAADHLKQTAERLREDPLLEQLGEHLDKQVNDPLKNAAGQFDTAKDMAARDQIGPLSKAVDQLAAAERQLRQIQQDVASLERLEAKLMRLANDASQAREMARKLREESSEANLNEARDQAADISDHLDELMNQNPELVAAARRDALARLANQTQQLEELANRQQAMADAIQSSAKDRPSESSEPSNDESQTAAERLLTAQRALEERTERLQVGWMADVGDDGRVAPRLQAAAKAAEAARKMEELGDLSKAAASNEELAREMTSLQEVFGDAANNGGPLSSEFAVIGEEAQRLADELRRAGQPASLAGDLREAAQEQYAESAGAMRESLRELAEELASDPLNLEGPGVAAAQSSEQLRTAVGEMQAAAHQLSQGANSAAEEQARLAATQLRQAVTAAKNLEGRRDQSPISDAVGQSLAEAARRAQAARKSLNESQTNTAASSSNDCSSGSEAKGSQASGGKPGQRGSPGGEGDSAADALEEAAAALARAAQATQSAWEREGFRPNPAMAGGQSGGTGQPGEAALHGDFDLKADNSPLRQELDGGGGVLGFRRWGDLTGELKTEILQGAGLRLRPEYASQIRAYFETIADPDRQPRSAVPKGMP